MPLIDLRFYLYQKSFPLYPFPLFVCLQYMHATQHSVHLQEYYLPQLNSSRIKSLIPIPSEIQFYYLWANYTGVLWFNLMKWVNWEWCFHFWNNIASHLGDIQVFVKKLVMSSVLPYRKTNDKMWNIFRNVEWCSSKLALVNIQQTGYKMALIVQLPTVFLPDKVCEELMIPFFFVRTEHSLLSTSWFGDLRQHGL